MEIWNEIPLIGKTKDERRKYHNKMSETLKADDSAEPKNERRNKQGKKEERKFLFKLITVTGFKTVTELEKHYEYKRAL